MLIPSIDLQGGQIVQLVQGERLALASDDFDGWIAKFERFPKVQLIDLDAAKNQGNNRALVASICRRLPCRVGGGVRTVDRRSGDSRRRRAQGHRRLAAVSRRAARPGVRRSAGRRRRRRRVSSPPSTRAAGSVVIDGWRTRLAITPVDAIRRLEPCFDEFLFTNVDVEGLMRASSAHAIEEVRGATDTGVTAAGGVTTEEEIDWLDGLGVDAVAGMAIYTGRLKI